MTIMIMLLADVATEQDRRLMMVCVVQTPKYGQIRTESRLFRALSRRRLTYPCCC